MTSQIRVGLRFSRHDAPLLAMLAQRVRSGEIQGDVNTFAGAADAARTGEPFIVHCENAAEAHVMAALYVRLGCRQPVVDELTGMRPSR